MKKTRINPLSRRPRRRRLVMAVRGAAGSGKSVFASTLADAGVGKLCFFDVERKARLLPGSDGSKFDAIEIYHPDELSEFIDWALDGEGRERGYGCYALDSWAMYFGRKHRETIQAVRDRTGDPMAQPTAEQLSNDQMIFQEVLRRLCTDSGACVVITDQIGAKGKEEREENEMGQVLPMTAGGLEYFVDVMVEMSMRMDFFEPVRVARVVKTNSSDFPIGLEIEDPTFSKFLARMSDGPRPEAVPTILAAEEKPLPQAAEEVVPSGPTVEDLLAKANKHGVSRAQVATAARYYCKVNDISRLAPEQIQDLYDRMVARYGPDEPNNGQQPQPSQPSRQSQPSQQSQQSQPSRQSQQAPQPAAQTTNAYRGR
ncbi:MAG: hypothetical protein ACPGWR_30565 [Ardenticatenaceae bacterium]